MKSTNIMGRRNCEATSVKTAYMYMGNCVFGPKTCSVVVRLLTRKYVYANFRVQWPVMLNLI